MNIIDKFIKTKKDSDWFINKYYKKSKVIMEGSF